MEIILHLNESLAAKRFENPCFYVTFPPLDSFGDFTLWIVPGTFLVLRLNVSHAIRESGILLNE